MAKFISAYSGGLDTSIILKWLVLQGYPVVCFLADVGQANAEDAAAIEKKDSAAGRRTHGHCESSEDFGRVARV